MTEGRLRVVALQRVVRIIEGLRMVVIVARMFTKSTVWDSSTYSDSFDEVMLALTYLIFQVVCMTGMRTTKGFRVFAAMWCTNVQAMTRT